MQLLLYGSTTGNTEAVSWFITKNAKNKTKCLYVNEAIEQDITSTESIIIGCSTWGGENDDPTLQEDMDYFLSDNLKLFQNKKIFLFGCGDTYYPHFCGALDIIERALKKQSTIIHPILRIADPWSKHQNDILNWLLLVGL